MLSINQLCKNYNMIRALRNLSFHLEPGDIFGLLGPNGAGKSTTLKILAGLLESDSGEILFCGNPVLPRTDHDFRRNIAYVPDEPFLYPKLTGEEHLCLYADLYGVDRPTLRRKADYFFEYFDFDRYRHRLTETYSAGTKQKLLLSQALLVEPRILLLDEPLMSVDPLISRRCKRYLKERAQRGTVILFATHILPLALEVSRRIGIITEGYIRQEITQDELSKIKDPVTLESRYSAIVTGDDHSV
jgi:ABC-2 type transport system ATP-binding protein